MTYHVPRRHPVAFGTRTPVKSKSVYYNLQFWLFLGHFWTFSDPVIFYPETFLGRPTWLLTLCGCFAPFVLPRKASKHPICSFLVKPKIASKRTYTHPYIRSKAHDSFLETSHSPRSYPVAFGARTPGKSKNVYYNLQFLLFLRHFLISLDLVILSPETFLGVPTWLLTLCGTLAESALPRKASNTPFVHLSWNPNCIEISIKASTYSFKASWLFSNDLPCP